MNSLAMYHGLYTVKQEEDFTMSSSALPSGKHHGTKGGRQATSTSPVSASASDQEGKTGSKNRRRIQLACTRCRKRKIRCSGETSDGMACTNCQAAKHHDCQFLRPQTNPLVPAPGSALTFSYPHPSMTNSGNNPLVTSSSSDSFGGRIHQQQADSSTLSPLAYGMTYARSHSLSDLETYHRVDSLQREPHYVAAAAAAAHSGGAGLMEDIYNTPYNLHSASCIPATSTSDTMTDYYGSLDSSKAWGNATAVAMAADLARSQNTIFYATDIPTLFPASNLLSPGDMSTNRILPMPTSSSGSGSSPSAMNAVGGNNTPYLRDTDMVSTSTLSFMPGEEDDGDEEGSTNIRSPTTKPSKNLSFISRPYGKPDTASTTTECFTNTFAGGVVSSHSHGGHHGQGYMSRYTAVTDGSLDTPLPIASTPASSPAFARSGTTDFLSDAKERLMMSNSKQRRQELQQ